MAVSEQCQSYLNPQLPLLSYFWPFLASGFNYIDITAPHVRRAVLMRGLGLQLGKSQSIYLFEHPWPNFHGLKSGLGN